MIYKKTHGWRVKDHPELFATREEAEKFLNGCEECESDPCECEEEWNSVEETSSTTESWMEDHF
jgi:uncharacterized protein YfcZ (UPF0381/DUF406 family)